MFRRFGFEQEFYEGLTCVPMSTRHKLDVAGAKISLKAWNKFSAEERAALCEQALVGPLGRDRYRELVAQALQRIGEPWKELDPAQVDQERAAWGNPNGIPPAVAECATATGQILTAEDWRRFDDLSRYALLKLSKGGHESEKFAAALAEFKGAPAFNDQGLIPVVAQDARTGSVRMQAWANAEALRITAETGMAHFFSRSRGALWKKGETSGNMMRVREIRLDCDGDSALYLVDAEGPSCHTGTTSCFFRPIGAAGALGDDDGPPDPPAVILSRVAQVIAQRRSQTSEKSYVASLLAAGWPKILGKITEEAREVTEALPESDSAHTAHEAADVIFHLLVGLEAAGVPVETVFAELAGRFGTSGHAEKASRPKK